MASSTTQLPVGTGSGTRLPWMNPTTGWEILHDRFYRKYEVYTLPWKIPPFSQLVIRTSRFGGPVAVLRDPRKATPYASPGFPVLAFYTSAGKLLSSVKFARPGVVDLGWTDDDFLVVIFKDATVIMYSIDGAVVKEFNLGLKKGEGSQDIISACVWGGGIVVLLGPPDFEFFSVNSFKEPVAIRLMNPGLTTLPSALAVIEPQYSLSTSVEMLVCIERSDGSGGVFQVDAGSVIDKDVKGVRPFSSVAVSPTGKLFACFAKNGVLYVFNADFRKLTEFDTESHRLPSQLVWCGNDSVLMWWEGEKEGEETTLLMVGPHNQWIRYRYSSSIHLVAECDGVRVFSQDKCEFIQAVPPVLEEIFSIGSTAPPAILFNALQLFQEKNPKSDDLIRSLTETQLVSAVDSCLEAATHQFDDSNTQHQLLLAASFGKSFLSHDLSPNPDETFVLPCKRLRVLNSVRHWDVGIPLTYVEFQKLTVNALIDRLVAQKQYLLSLRICEFLDISSTRVKVRWACDRVLRASVRGSEEKDEDVRDAIVEKLGTGAVPYVQIARVAHRAGKVQLAVMLLDFEARADQALISLLFDMRRFELAISKAVNSGDTDLILSTIHRVQRQHLSKAEFFQLLQTRKATVMLFIKYFSRTQPSLVESFFVATDRPQDTAFMYFKRSFEIREIKQRMMELEKAKGFPASKDWAFHRSCVVEQQKLLVNQFDLETDFGKKFLGLSVSETIITLVKCAGAGVRRAWTVKKEFAIPDKRFWYLMIRAFSEKNEWEQLYTFSRDKKSPVGYEPFAEACVAQRAFSEAMRYIPRVTNQDRKIELLLASGHTREAQELQQARKQIA